MPPARRTLSALAVVAVAATTLAGPGTAGASQQSPGRPLSFDRTATYPVFQNRPAGEDPATATVAEISAVSADGRLLVYTDALARRIGFLNITDPQRPRGLGTLSLSELGNVEDEPTSVAVVGQYVLVSVNTSRSFVEPSGRLDVIGLRSRERVASFDLGGQPDSIAISADLRYAAVAIENERDEEATPPVGGEGDLPQAPAGFVQLVDLVGEGPQRWRTRKVSLTADDGSALPMLADAGLAEPTDPEPEYVTINGKDQLAVTLQENNGIVVVDLPTGRIVRAFSTGTVTVRGVDTVEDGAIGLTGAITDVPREPDSVAWVDDRYLATANEGDWRGGSRGWSVFDSRTGRVVWDAGNSFDRLAVSHGLHNEDRAEKKGSEPEGLAVAEFGGVPYAFVGSERSNFVAVYDITRPDAPLLRQVLSATNGPEGLLPIPARDMLVVSSETDEASVGVRASVTLYQLGEATPAFPSIVSGPVRGGGAPIGWGALGALSAAPGQRSQLYSVTDAAYTPTRILTIDAGAEPAMITASMTVTAADGTPVGYDAEGIFARPQGGFWLAVEGATGAGNKLVRLGRGGRTQEIVTLPAEVAAGLGGQGFEGVTAGTDDQGREVVWVALQRGLATDPAGIVRLGRYDVEAASWSWFGYRIGRTSTPGDWIGLSELTIVGNRLAVIERDKLNGPAARVKRIYTVELPLSAAAQGSLRVLPKTLAYDVLPDLRATNGWTQEKLEGLTVAGDGQVYAITDNDAVQDATGETVFLRLGHASRIFPDGWSARCSGGARCSA